MDTKEYARGYAAGRKWAATEKTKNELWNQAFLAALPSCILATNWKCDNEKITNLTDRTALAARFANEALKHMK